GAARAHSRIGSMASTPPTNEIALRRAGMGSTRKLIGGWSSAAQPRESRAPTTVPYMLEKELTQSITKVWLHRSGVSSRHLQPLATVSVAAGAAFGPRPRSPS